LGTLGINCPFCGAKLSMEMYRKGERRAPSITVFCDNDACSVKPSTIDTHPSAAFADVAAWR
jgi:hypothetical protein